MNSIQRIPRVLRCEAAAFADAAADWLISAIEETIDTRGECALALAGGETPRAVYESMAQPAFANRIEWHRVAVYFSDERCVHVDDPQSNYRMAYEALLQYVPIPHASIHRMQCERPDRDAAASEYERQLPARFDLLLLGMGADGHTASLFPHSPALAQQARRVVAADGPRPSSWRLTITPPVIQAAAMLIVLVTGAKKAATVARALEGEFVPEELPIQLALGGTWFLDHAAARELRAFSS